MATKIAKEDRVHKFCRKCGCTTARTNAGGCMDCQRQRSQGYRVRLKESGGAFSFETKQRLIAANPHHCPKCKMPWNQVPKHSQHPDTPWHFDHRISPQHGGTNADENAQILCWPCNLRKVNKLEAMTAAE